MKRKRVCKNDYSMIQETKTTARNRECTGRTDGAYYTIGDVYEE